MSAPLPREPGVTYETKVVNLIVQDRADKKKYERMLADGWEVEDVQKRTLLRGATYSFRRPKRNKPEDPLAKWAKNKLKAMDEKMQADNEKFRQERLERKAARAEEKAAKKAAKEERK